MKSIKHGISPRRILIILTALLCTLLLSSCLNADGLLIDPGAGGSQSGTQGGPQNGTHVCSYSKTVATEAYNLIPATCTELGTYYYSCDCGKAGTLTFIGGEYKAHECVNQIATRKYLVSEATMTSPAL